MKGNCNIFFIFFLYWTITPSFRFFKETTNWHFVLLNKQKHGYLLSNILI